jgi:hypothetical protein
MVVHWKGNDVCVTATRDGEEGPNEGQWNEDERRSRNGR